MTTQANQSRFRLITREHSNDTWGWNGWLLDTQTKMRYSLYKTYIDYELDGEVGYGASAFDTKKEMIAAAMRKARRIDKTYGA